MQDPWETDKLSLDQVRGGQGCFAFPDDVFVQREIADLATAAPRSGYLAEYMCTLLMQ